MATIDKTNNTKYPFWDYKDNAIYVVNDITFTGVQNGDVLECLYVPAKHIVKDLFLIIEQKTNNTCSVVIGDGDDNNGYMASGTTINIGSNSTTTYYAVKDTSVGTTAPAYAGGKYYPTADTVDLTVTAGATLTKGKVRIVATLLKTGD